MWQPSEPRLREQLNAQTAVSLSHGLKFRFCILLVTTAFTTSSAAPMRKSNLIRANLEPTSFADESLDEEPQLALQLGAPVSLDNSTGEDQAPLDLIQEIKDLFGSAQWPSSGLARRPSDNPNDTGNVILEISIIVLAILLKMLCSGFILWYAAAARWKTATHMYALTSAIVWRHLHQRALLLHIVRIGVPACVLVLLYYMREFLVTQFEDQQLQNVAQAIGGKSSDIVEGTLEFALSVTMVYVAMLSMVFFVWHVNAERESGFRHLLQVSGLSRYAYILPTAGVDGVMQAFVGLVGMLIFAASVLHLRMVLWSSPSLMLFFSFLVCISSVMTGYLLHFLCPSARFGGPLASIITLIVVVNAPVAPLQSAVPRPGDQSWKVLIFPTIPSYCGLFELVAGCVKGRCLTVSDVTDALWAGKWSSPWAMVVGKSERPEMTPPEALVSYLGLVFVQLAIAMVIIIAMDIRSNPALHDTQVQGSMLPEGSNSILSVQGLVHHYGWLQGVRQSTDDRVLNGVSFSIGPGGMLGLLGPNGAGKTTTIRCITGEEAPSAGGVAINPTAGGGSSVYVGLCPQETVVNTDLTVEENLCFFAYLRGALRTEAVRCVNDVLTATNLEDKRSCLPDTLSGGMKRRLAVGCAMIATPAVAILDEPTTGLDPMSRRGIWNTINDIRAQGGCCLLTTHMLEEAEALCSYLVILKKGVVAAQGSVQQLKDEWGTGYMLSIDSEAGREDKAKQYVQSLLSPADREPIKASAQQGQVTFKVTGDEESLGHLMIAIAREKATHGIQHWGISQASLEDTYLHIIQDSVSEAPEVAIP